MKKSHFQARKAKSTSIKKSNHKITNSSKDYEKETKYDNNLTLCNSISGNYSELEIDETILGDIEYAKALQIALKDAINQNEKLNEELNKCIQENKELKEELEEKDNVIYELSQYYQFCQNNHLNNNF